jgi:magnesium transporter
MVQSRLQETLILAFFLPGIVYLADAVGTQTETVVIRGLSVGVRIGRIMVRELLAGFGIGLTLALVAVPVVLWRWGAADVALALGLSIFAACSIATVVAMALPWILDRFDMDPAFGSGPLATVIQDLLSIVIFCHCRGGHLTSASQFFDGNAFSTFRTSSISRSV